MHTPQRSFKKLVTFLFVLFLSGQISAQLVITSKIGAAALVKALAGGGLTISNVVLNCDTGAYGSFSNGSTTNLGFNKGILMTSGSAYNAIGPDVNGNAATKCIGTTFSDPDLTNIDPSAIFDPCILSFDITPHCNTLTFRFVFGSEEYPNWVNQFNDVFGFFITGPNPAGGSYSSKNIATIPGGTVVSINSVNNGNANSGPCTNCAYYVNNINGQTIQYNGLTTVLTVTVPLVPCQSYHFKIAVADAGDCNLDSGVFVDFIECSTALNVLTTTNPAHCLTCDGTASINLTGGTPPYAYTWLPSGTNTSSVANLCPGKYSVIINDQTPCNQPDTVVVNVPSSVPYTVVQSQTNVACNATCSGSTTVNVTGGTNPITYSWTPSGGTAASAGNLCPGIYTCTISDNAGCSSAVVDTIIKLPLFTLASAATSISCNSLCNGSTTVSASGGTAPFTYSWSPAGGSAATATALCPGNYTCTVTDATGCVVLNSSVLTQPSALSVTASNDSVCLGRSTTISVNPTGGTAPYTVAWNNGLPNGQSNSVTPTANTLYKATVTDANGCVKKDSVLVTLHFAPPATFSTNNPSAVFVLNKTNNVAQWCLTNTTPLASSSLWYASGSQSSTLPAPCFTFQDTGYYCATLFSINTSGCKDSATKCIEVVEAKYTIPNVFTPNGDGRNDFFGISNSGMASVVCTIYDRWGVDVGGWNSPTGFWDGRSKTGHPLTDGTYYYVVTLVDRGGKAYTEKGFIELIR